MRTQRKGSAKRRGAKSGGRRVLLRLESGATVVSAREGEDPLQPLCELLAREAFIEAKRRGAVGCDGLRREVERQVLYAADHLDEQSVRFVAAVALWEWVNDVVIEDLALIDLQRMAAPTIQ